MKKINWFIISLIFFSAPVVARAGILDALGCIPTGTCGLADVELGFQLLTNWLLSAIGALGLLYFIWGAGQWITSYGRAEKVSHGREIMMGSVTAIVIALVSYVLIQFFVNDVLLGGNNNELRISLECVNAAQGKVCNEPLRNYVCSGTFTEDDKKTYSNLCVTRCQLQNITGVPGDWSCLVKGSFIDNDRVEKMESACPTEDYICVNTQTVSKQTFVPPSGGVGGTGSCGGLDVRGINTAQCNDASAGLTALLRCLSSLPNFQQQVVITSISDDRHIGNLQDCQGDRYNSSSCVHTRNSCHYGGRDLRPYSCAVDLALRGGGISFSDIEAMADGCGAQYTLNEGDHVHASVSGCNCDN